MIKRSVIISSLCLLGALGCSKDDTTSSGSTTVSNAVTQSYSTVTTKANRVTKLQPQSSSTNGFSPMASFGSAWTTSTDPFRDATQSGNPTISPKAWMGIQLDADAVRTNGSKISPFGRLNDALQVFCAMGVAIDSDKLDDNEYPIDGTGLSETISSTDATNISNQCGMDTSNIEGETVSMDVSTPSDTSTYAKKIVMNMPQSMGGGSQTYFIKSDDVAVNVATTEVNSNGIHRTVVAYDKSTQVLKMEYISAPDAALSSSDHVAAYRLYSDEANDEGFLMVLEHTEGSPDSIIEYVLAGKPDVTDAKFSLSMNSSGLPSGDGTYYHACVNSSDGSIDSDGSRCGDTSTTVDGFDVSTASAITGFVSGYDNTVYDSVSETTSLDFTTSNFHTLDFSEN